MISDNHSYRWERVVDAGQRGNDRRILFEDDSDRERFLAKLTESVTLFEIRLYLYCLMTNHVHLVLGTPRANLSRFMQRLETAYMIYFNSRHMRCGHLFQGRFGSVLVDQDEYILKLSRYVHLNPVFTKPARRLSLRERVRILRAYPWSSYRSYIGRVEAIYRQALKGRPDPEDVSFRRGGQTVSAGVGGEDCVVCMPGVGSGRRSGPATSSG